MADEPPQLIDAFWIDLENGQPYEMGAVLLTAAAFPDVIDTDRFGPIHQSVCSEASRSDCTSAAS